MKNWFLRHDTTAVALCAAGLGAAFLLALIFLAPLVKLAALVLFTYLMGWSVWDQFTRAGRAGR